MESQIHRQQSEGRGEPCVRQKMGPLFFKELKRANTQASSLSNLCFNRSSQDMSDIIMYFDPYKSVEIKQRNLPHWQQKGAAYFVTFRLYDSIPHEVSENIKREREQWLEANKISEPSEVKKPDQHKKIEYYRLFSKRYDDLLDNGYGSCILNNKECKKIVEKAINYFDGKRYYLDKFVVMPNHVHVIVIPRGEWTLSKITHSWKSYTANELNKIINQRGPVWMPESFDHIIRSPEQLERIRQYIEDNPKVNRHNKLSGIPLKELDQCITFLLFCK